MPHKGCIKSTPSVLGFFLNMDENQKYFTENLFHVHTFLQHFLKFIWGLQSCFLFITNKYLLEKESHCNQLELRDSFCQGWQNSLTYHTV